MKRHRADTPALINSQPLRKQLTDAEAKLWQVLRMHQLENIHFRRQHAIGKYIVDFCAPRKKLILEIDGSQHLDRQSYDAERTEYLESRGYRVLRFWNNDILCRLEDVVQAILLAIGEEKTTPSQPPPF